MFPTNCKIVLFYLKLTLVSQLKLLPSLFELKDNDTIDMSTIIKKLHGVPRNRPFLISEIEKVTFTFTCHKCRK